MRAAPEYFDTLARTARRDLLDAEQEIGEDEHERLVRRWTADCPRCGEPLRGIGQEIGIGADAPIVCDGCHGSPARNLEARLTSTDPRVRLFAAADFIAVAGASLEGWSAPAATVAAANELRRLAVGGAR